MSGAARITPGSLAVHLGSAAIALGLAILGRGGFAAFFSETPLMVLAISLVALSCVALFSGGNASTGDREDRSNRWVLAALISIGVLAAYLPAYTDRTGTWTLDGQAIRWAGIVLFIAGGVLRLWPVFVLGNRFSAFVAIQPGHTLVTHGIYRVVRNPSYLGMIVNAVGWVLAFRSVLGLLLLAFLIPTIIARIRSEEALLRWHFGSAYDAYCARTARLIPGLY